MSNEKEWYEAEGYRQEVNGNCSYEECWHDVYDVEKIVAEATSRGIEQGKREALEEADNDATAKVLTELSILIRPETMRAYLAKMEENKESVGHCDYPSLAELLVESRKKTYDYRCHHKSI